MPMRKSHSVMRDKDGITDSVDATGSGAATSDDTKFQIVPAKRQRTDVRREDFDIPDWPEQMRQEMQVMVKDTVSTIVRTTLQALSAQQNNS